MLPLKRILCPTDFSADSRAALRVAGEMAQYFTAELTVLHVNPSPQPAVWPYEGFGINPMEAGVGREEALALREKELAAEAQQTLPSGLNLHLQVLEGDPADLILETARQWRADMIVLTPHGHNRIRKAIFGSTAEKVVKQSPCPVVTMHAGLEAAHQAQGASAAQSRA
jgi:nucleotide-binding universal stress UspA family protein